MWAEQALKSTVDQVSAPRRYEQTHPWISFECALEQNMLWFLLPLIAEARAH